MPLRRRPGFTLTEVLIATSLLTLGLGTAAMLMAGAFGTYRSQNKSLEINHLVHDQMETLTATPYESLKDDIKRARRPGDPARDDLPAQRDYAMNGEDNGVTAEYRMVPPTGERDDYTIKRAPKHEGIDVVDGGARRNHDVRVSMRLEYWDPVFDKPAGADRGLIRAAYDVDWDGVHDGAVKYVAR